MTAVAQTLLSVTVGSGIIWAVIMLFRRAFRGKLSPGMQMLIWSIFILRLAVPLSFEVNLPRPEWMPEYAVTASAETQPLPQISQIEATRGTFLPEARTHESATTSVAVLPDQHSEPLKELTADLTWQMMFVAVWAAGAVVSGIVSACAYRQLRRELRAQSVSPAPSLERCFQQCCRDIGVRSRVKLTMQTGAAGPALVFPNTVVLPQNVLKCDRDAVEMAVRHELTHYRRGDHLLSVLLCVLRAAYWFNPFVWLAVRTIREDMETACDHDVLRHLGPDSRPIYARSVLAMYKNTTPPQTALAMASGSGRRHVEMRIRGMYLPERSSRIAKLTSVVLACMLAATCFTTGCQPTPQREAVVNRQSGDMARAEGTVDDGSHYMPTTYAPTQKWKEDFEKDGVIISSDIDVLEPAVETYAAQTLKERELTQDMADNLIRVLAGEDANFVQLPLPRSQESLEEDLIELKEARSQAETAGESEEQLRSFDAWIAEAEEKIRNAPADVELKPADTKFTYEYDLSGNALTDGADDYIEIGVQGERAAVINASRSRVTALAGPSFYYSAFAQAWREADARETLALEQQEGSGDSQMIAQIQNALSVMESDTTDMTLQEQRAAALLEELGIDGVQITSCEKAAFTPLSDVRDVGSSVQKTDFLPSAWIGFSKEVGGVPCANQVDGLRQENVHDASVYQPPFMPEEGAVMLDAEGNVVQFRWTDMSEAVPDSLAAVETLSFEDVRDRVEDQLYYVAKNVYTDDWTVEISPTEASLVSAYINAYEDPDAVMIVPAWKVRVTGVAKMGNGDTHEINWPTVFINAMDGSPILLPPLEDSDYQ